VKQILSNVTSFFTPFSVQLKTNQGRFVLSSNGDLQIVQLHRTDSGTYVCVAYNGIGNSVEREVTLTVDGMFGVLFNWLWLENHFLFFRCLILHFVVIFHGVYGKQRQLFYDFLT
jgi:hypothetical protein